MKNIRMTLLLVTFAFYAHHASAKTIPLANAGFENGTLYSSPIQGWTFGSNEGSALVFNEDRYGHSEGSHVASVNHSGWIYQNSGHALLASRDYVLSVDMKRGGGTDTPGDVALELRSGASYATSTLLSSTTVTAASITASWKTFSLSYTAPSSGAVVGQPVWVRIIQVQASPDRYEYVLWDKVKFEYTSSYDISLTNAGFESGMPYSSPVSGWTFGSNEGNASIFKEGRYGSSELSHAASVNQSGWIYQSSGHALLANKSYVLSVDMKRGNGTDTPGDAGLELWAGPTYETSTRLAYTKIDADTITDEWQTFSLTLTTPASGGAIGQNVWVRILQVQDSPNRYEFVFWDRVRFARYDAERKLVTGATHGWKFPGQLLTELDDLQDLPFDGIDVYTNFGDMAFANSGAKNYNNAGGADGEDNSVGNMEDIVNGNLWGRFTDNFMHLTVTENFDWYNDANWADILDKVRAVARIGAAGGAKGIMFDPEGHSSTCYLVDEVTYCEMPWTYADQPIADTCGDCYAAVQAKVHARGIEFIDAIEEYMPNHTLLTLFWTTYRRDRNFDVQGDPYGLLNSFMLGVLEGAGAGTKIVDGDELSYYPSLHAYAAGHTCLANATTNGLIPSSLQAKYLDKVSLAHAVWDWDEHIGTAEVMGNERIYPAMLDSSHYVWFYTQNTETQPREYLNHIGIRPGFIEAINRGKAWAIEEANW